MIASPNIEFANSLSEKHIRTATYGPARFDFNRLLVDDDEIKRLCRERIAIVEGMTDEDELKTMDGNAICKVGDWRAWFAERQDG